MRKLAVAQGSFTPPPDLDRKGCGKKHIVDHKTRAPKTILGCGQAFPFTSHAALELPPKKGGCRCDAPAAVASDELGESARETKADLKFQVSAPQNWSYRPNRL
jgi:hypothetical protein